MKHSHGLPAGVHLRHNDMEAMTMTMVVVVVVTLVVVEVTMVVVVVETFVFSCFASLLFTIVKKVKVISFPKWEAKFGNFIVTYLPLPSDTGHCCWYEIMAPYNVKLFLTEISASRQDRRVLQKNKIIRIKFLSILQTSRYV